MSTVYGREFAPIYNKHWAAWGPKMWPMLRDQVRRRCPQALAWLDLCCGTGSLLELVEDAGFRATGVDRSQHQLAFARKNAPTARLIRKDICQLSLGCQFDVVTCLYDSLNYLTNKRDLAKAVRVASRHLARPGIFAFDVNTFEGLRAEWCRTTVLDYSDSTVILQSSFDQRRALGKCRITGFVRQGTTYRRMDEVHEERGYRPSEIDDILRTNGLRFVCYDAYRGGRRRKRSPRLLYVAWK